MGTSLSMPQKTVIIFKGIITMKNYFVISGLLLMSFSLVAQTGIINNSARINISSGAIISLSGGTTANYTNTGNGRIDLEGTIKITGNWTNNSSTYPVFTNLNTTGTVSFIGTTQQTIGGSYSTTFENLILNNSSGFLLGNHQTINNTFTMTAGVTDLASFNLTMGSINNLSGTGSVSNMLVSSGTGEFRFTPVVGSTNYYLPVGDIMGTAEYSRVYFYLTSATFGSNPKIGVRVVNTKHPQNQSTSDFLNRYWIMNSTDITTMSANIKTYYTDADVSVPGTEANIKPGYYIAPFWKANGTAYPSSNYLSYTSITSLADFTGGEASVFAVTLAISNVTAINEGNENGKQINVNVNQWGICHFTKPFELAVLQFTDRSYC